MGLLLNSSRGLLFLNVKINKRVNLNGNLYDYPLLSEGGKTVDIAQKKTLYIFATTVYKTNNNNLKANSRTNNNPKTGLSKVEECSSMLVGFVMYRVDGVSFPLYDSVETVVFIGFVFHNSDGTVRFMKGIFSNYFVSNTFLLLFVDVMMFRVVYSVLVFIMRYSLHKPKTSKVSMGN